MNIKLGRGKFQEILQDGDIDAIAAGEKDMGNLRKDSTPRHSAFTAYSKNLSSRYDELGYLLTSLKTKKSQLKNVPTELQGAINDVITHRKTLMRQLPGEYFVRKAAAHLDRGDGFWGGDYNSDIRFTIEQQWHEGALEHIKSLPECSKFWAI